MADFAAKSRYGLSLIKAKALGQRTPLLMEFALTYNCNLRCIYCYGKYGYERKTDMPTERVYSIIDQLHREGTQMLHFTGGEPTLRKDLPQIVSHAKGLGLHVGMTSNGAAIPFMAESLRSMDRVVLSLDGSEKAHSENRGKISYKQVMAAAEACTKYGIPFSFKCVLTKNNFEEIPWILETAKKFNTRAEVTLLFSQKTADSGEGHGAYKVDKALEIKTLENIAALKEAGEPLMINPAVHRYLIDWHRHHDTERVTADQMQEGFRYQKCYAGTFSGFIHYDGELFPCNQLLGHFKPKNVLEVGFKEAWDHLQTNNCRACRIDFLNEKHFFHGLNLDYLKNVAVGNG